MSKFAALDLGRVVAAHGRHFMIESPEGERTICHPRGKKSDCVVGDWVRWQPAGDEGVIEHVEPRRNLLHRQDEWKIKSFAANVVPSTRCASGLRQHRDFFNFQEFSSGDFVSALAETLAAESLTRVLYPDDSTTQGKGLRFLQQYSALLMLLIYQQGRHLS